MLPKPAQHRTVEIDGKIFKVRPNLKTYRGKRPIGNTTGYYLFEFLRAIFVGNEEWKLTDAHLVDLVMQEFSEFPDIINSIQGNAKRTNKIPKYRSLFNTAAMGCVPEITSFAYSSNGKPMKFRNNELSHRGCAEVARHYRIPDVRFLSADEVAKFRREALLTAKRKLQQRRKQERTKDSAGRPNVKYVGKPGDEK
jgi:hypothetical protein